MEIEKPHYSFSDLREPHSKYQDEKIEQLIKSGINHAECLETLLQRVESLEDRLAKLEQK